MAVQMRGLERGVPNPIISFERAHTVERSLQIRSVWQRKGELARAWWNMWLDFVFIAAYTAFAVAVLSWSTSAMRHRRGIAAAGTILAWIAFVPATLDVIEDVALLRILAFGALKDNTLPALAYWCATVKFAVGTGLLAVGLPYALWAFAHARRS